MRSRRLPARREKRAASTSGAESSRIPGALGLAFAVGLALSGCGGGPASVLDPPSFISGAHPAPGAATYEPVTGDTGAGEYAFPWELYEDGPECRKPDPPTSCPPVRIGIEDTPVAFTHPVFHGRVVLDGATFAYWRPLASQATQSAFAACTRGGTLPGLLHRFRRRSLQSGKIGPARCWSTWGCLPATTDGSSTTGPWETGDGTSCRESRTTRTALRLRWRPLAGASIPSPFRTRSSCRWPGTSTPSSRERNNTTSPTGWRRCEESPEALAELDLRFSETC